MATLSRILAWRIPWTVAWEVMVHRICRESDMTEATWHAQSQWRQGNSSRAIKILKDDAIKVLHSVCQQIWKTPHWPQDWKRSILFPVPKKGSTKEYSNYQTIALIFHANKVMLKILHAGLQCYMNQELPDVQAWFRKGRGTRDQIANIRWIIEKARDFQKNIYLFHLLC